jgi:hypothetical protein
MMTASSEITKATGMLPVAGGTSRVSLSVGLFSFALLPASAGPTPAKILPDAKEGIAAAKPIVADLLSKSRLFIMSFHCFLL